MCYHLIKLRVKDTPIVERFKVRDWNYSFNFELVSNSYSLYEVIEELKNQAKDVMLKKNSSVMQPKRFYSFLELEQAHNNICMFFFIICIFIFLAIKVQVLKVPDFFTSVVSYCFFV